MEVSEQEFEARVNEKEEYADAVGQEAFAAAEAMGLPYQAAVAEGQKAQDDAERHYDEVTAKKQAYADAVAKQMAQRALDDAEKEFDDTDAERAAYANAVAQQQYEVFLASGYSYQQAINEGQAALNFAEADYDSMLADQQAYADAVAQQNFEMVLQMGYSYP